jgi:Sporulation and spore germination
MTYEPRSLNHHNHHHHHHHDERNANDAFPPELDALAARLSADGAAWQNRLPDTARVAERIRAIPDGAPSAVSVDDVTLPMGAESPTGYGAGWNLPRVQRRRRVSSSGWGRFLGFAAAAVVVALIATIFAQLATRGGQTTGPAIHPAPTHAQSQPTAVPTLPATTATATGYPVLVYFSKNPDSYNDPMAVFPVHRISPTLGVATYAIQQLIAGPTSSEASAGYFTELSTVLQRGGASSCGGPDFKIALNMRGTAPETGTATLQFCRQTASPGIGADARIKAEIAKTLTQFSNITKVVILLQDGHCFGDESGADVCLK